MKKIFVTIIFVLILLLQVNVYANSISDLISPIQYSDEFRQYLNLSEEEKAKTEKDHKEDL